MYKVCQRIQARHRYAGQNEKDFHPTNVRARPSGGTDHGGADGKRTDIISTSASSQKRAVESASRPNKACKFTARAVNSTTAPPTSRSQSRASKSLFHYDRNSYVWWHCVPCFSENKLIDFIFWINYFWLNLLKKPFFVKTE